MLVLSLDQSFQIEFETPKTIASEISDMLTKMGYSIEHFDYPKFTRTKVECTARDSSDVIRSVERIITTKKIEFEKGYGRGLEIPNNK